ncbi:MAG: ATP-dependent helicase [Acutalibacteraceae bacterium]
MSVFMDLRKKLIEHDFSRMNDAQREAVLSVDGPLLVLAGAGTGKTTVLVNRIAYIIKYGNAYYSDYVYREPSEKVIEELRCLVANGGAPSFDLEPLLKVDAPAPWQILAITFTNKAADELKRRLENMLGNDGKEVWASTFHSACVRFLRRDGQRLGFSKNFTIYDTDDSKRVMREVQRLLGIDDAKVPLKMILAEIGRAKDSLCSPEEYEKTVGNDQIKKAVCEAYFKYQELLKNADAMDFDDIIVNAVKLFSENPDILYYYQNRFKYIMVDEYQDTNHAQYVLTAMLSDLHKNFCVVGDDDQSIYKFRGATIENILSFEHRFKNAKTIRLERNYRSTSIILDAANAVIGNNTQRKGKNLWTKKTDGEKITIRLTSDELDEGRYISNEILNRVAMGARFMDFAVLYRTNAQSNSIERAFVYNGIPYRVIGGHRFYERKEIRDILAYFSVIVNTSDSARMRRIINEPKRGIGDSTINSVLQIADSLGISFFEVILRADDYPMLSRTASKLKEFSELIERLIKASERLSIGDFYNYLLEETGYLRLLAADKETQEERKANLMELMSNLVRYYEDNDEATLTGFLEEVALLADIDNYNEEKEAAVMMTLHSAKGLEFPCVFIAGVEEGLFPGNQVMYYPDELEEERRLAYVGITRAKEKLYITNAQSRMVYGSTTFTKPSRFIQEIPPELTQSNIGNTPDKFRLGAFGDSVYGSAKSRRNTASTRYTFNKEQRGFSETPDLSRKSSKPARDYKPGDSLTHKAFGKGMILTVTPMGNDMLLEVAFENGTKKLMANYLKQ